MSVDVVNDIEPRVQYTALAAQTDFDYPFPIFDDGDLVVDVDGATQALTTDYTVSGAGADTGGTVTFLAALAGGEVVTIYRDLPIERLTDFQQNGRFASAAFNDELDQIIMIQQQLAASVRRALRIPQVDATTSANMELPAAASRASKFLYFDAQGNPEMATAVTAGTVLSASTVGAVLYPQTAAETSAGVTPTALQYPPHDPRRYGSVDGAESTAALQDWLDANDYCELPPNHSPLISARLNPHSGMTIRGNAGSEIKMANSSVLATGMFFELDTLTDVDFIGLALNGNKANNDINDNYGDGIRTYACQRIRIQGCRIYNMPRDGISIAKHPVSGNNADIHIVGNVITGCGATSQTTGGEGILFVEGVRGVITDNVCTGNKLRGIEVETLSTTVNNVIVSNNICNSNWRGIGVNGASQMAVDGNICASNTDVGIAFGNTTLINGFTPITNNRVSGSLVGIDIEQYDFLSLVGNIVHTCTTGIRLEDASNHLITSNMFSSNTTNIDYTVGTNTNLRIHGNSGYATEAIGTATIPSGATTVVVTHGLSYTPVAAEISLVPAEQGTSDYGRFWVSSITSTQFTINVSADPGVSNLDIGWSVRRA